MFKEELLMIKYLIASHGYFSKGTKNFLKIIGGDSEQVYTLEAFIDNRSVSEKFEEVMEEIGEFEQLFIFCDLYGGSVAQEVFQKTIYDERNIQVIAGFNVSLVLDIVLKNKVMKDDEIEAAINESRDAIVYLNHVKQPTEEDSLF
ncbi:MAG: hypothetical protein RR847_03880 [Bacilli bacterium]